MQKINFYIGANNTTKRVEKTKALNIMRSYYDGGSVMDIAGFWKHENEESIVVSIVCDVVDKVLMGKVCRELNQELDQQAIMVEVLESNTQFISER